MTAHELDEAYEKIIDHYGIFEQMEICVEELSELIKALMKFKRCGNDRFVTEEKLDKARDCIIDELADVMIMRRQMELIFDAEDEVNDRIDFKVRRQLKRIEEEDKKLEEEMLHQRQD